MKKIKKNDNFNHKQDEIFYSDTSSNKVQKFSSNKKQAKIQQFMYNGKTPVKNNTLKSWNSKSQKKVRKKYIKAVTKKEHSAVQLKPARNKSEEIEKLQKFLFKKTILKKVHKKNNQFFNLKEDYFLLISEYVFAFPEFGFKNLTSFLKVIAKVTGRTLKSVQRRREKLKKLSRLQIWVLENFIIRFLPKMKFRKILNLKYENINIIKIDNTDIPLEEKQFIKNLIQDFQKIDLKPNELEKNQRKRGRPQSEKTLNLQQKCSELDLYKLYNPWLIEDLKRFLFQQKNSMQQIKLTDNFLKNQKLLDKQLPTTLRKSSQFNTPSINQDISIMSLLTNSVNKSINQNYQSTKNSSIKNFFAPVKQPQNLKNDNQKFSKAFFINETIQEEKSEFQNSKLSIFLINLNEQIISLEQRTNY